jgi:PAS domain-containing protein
MGPLFNNAVFLRHALDIIPSIVLVTDDDARILFRNKAARDLVGSASIYGSRAGEAMHCIHSADVPAGCGHGPDCKSCLVRNSVINAFSGKRVHRQRTDISRMIRGKAVNATALISASPFSFEESLYSLLIIEDISELSELRALLPICSSCKKIRGEDGRWERVETYIKRSIPESNLSHGLCPDCAKKLYPRYSR